MNNPDISRIVAELVERWHRMADAMEEAGDADFVIVRLRAIELDRAVSGNSPCGGCGETDENKRCIGCLHQFTAQRVAAGDDGEHVKALRELSALLPPFAKDPNCCGRGDHFTNGLFVRLGDIRKLADLLPKLDAAILALEASHTTPPPTGEAVAFGWWIECLGTDADFGQFVRDRSFVEMMKSHGVVKSETALFTHPAAQAEGRGVTDEMVERALDALDSSVMNSPARRVSWYGFTRADRLDAIRAALESALAAPADVGVDRG